MDGSTAELDIENIKIMLLLSDPDKLDKPVPLTRTVLYDPTLKSVNSAKLVEYPFFTTSVKYPEEKLRRLRYLEIYLFFFKNDDFIYRLKSEPHITDESKRDEVIRHNVRVMIELLLPTAYPASNNYLESHFKYIQGKPTPLTMNFNIVPQFISSTSTSSRYSYLKIDGKTYTVTKTVWLNDFINHPVYKDLVSSFRIFEKWRLNQSNKIAKLMSSKELRLGITAKKLFKTDNNYKDLRKVLKYMFDQKEKSTDYNELLKDITVNKKRILEFEHNINKHAELSSLVEEFEKDKQNDKNIAKLREYIKANELIEFLEKSTLSDSKVEQYSRLLKTTQDQEGRLRVMAPYSGTRTVNITIDEIIGYICDLYGVERVYTQVTIDDWDQYVFKPTNANTNIGFENFQAAINAINDKMRVSENDRDRDRGYSSRSTVTLESGFKTNLNLISEEIKRIKNLKIIKQKYFDEEDIDINFEDDEAGVKQEFRQNYKNYIDFVEKLKDFMTQKRESTNKELQDVIDNYIQGTTTKTGAITFDKLLKQVNAALAQNKKVFDIKSAQNDKIKALLDVGISSNENVSKENPKYEMYLMTDVILGELNDSNQHVISCNYKGEASGKLFKDLTRHLYFIVPRGIFYKLNEEETKSIQKIEKEEQVQNAKNPDNAVPASNVAVKPGIAAGGSGRKTMYRSRSKSNSKRLQKTRKIRRY